MIITKSEYAAMRGWSPAYVTKLKNKGRLVLTADGRVDVEASDALVAASKDPSKAGVVERWQRERGEEPAPPLDKPTRPLVLNGDEFDYQGARAKRETHEANLAEMRERERAGALVETERVVKALTDYAISSRSALERLPDRLAPLLAAETDPNRIYALLEEEIARICDEIQAVALAMPQQLSSTEQ